MDKNATTMTATMAQSSSVFNAHAFMHLKKREREKERESERERQKSETAHDAVHSTFTLALLLCVAAFMRDTMCIQLNFLQPNANENVRCAMTALTTSTTSHQTPKHQPKIRMEMNVKYVKSKTNSTTIEQKVDEKKNDNSRCQSQKKWRGWSNIMPSSQIVWKCSASYSCLCWKHDWEET